MTDKDSFVNVADLKRKLRAFANYRQYSDHAKKELLGIIEKLPKTVLGQLETTLEVSKNEQD